MFSSKPSKQCYYCGLRSDDVEAGGVWHCPNQFCVGPGAFYLREKLGYHDRDGYQTDNQLDLAISDCNNFVEKLMAAGNYEKAAFYQGCLEKLESYKC